jgi:hypothetical protein
MSTKHSGTENGIEKRTTRAVTGHMVVVPEGDATGRFEIYSATDGENNTYTVDLRAETCECGDYEHRQAHCKHQRRVKLALGIMDVPDALRGDIDPVLANSREKYGAEPVSDAHTPASAAEDTAPVAGKAAVATDGGQLVDPEPEITGPHMEPAELSNATTYWRCEDCGRESIHKRDTERAAFHAAGCSLR